MDRFEQGDTITHATIQGPILKVLDVVDRYYLLQNPDGHKFLRPIPWVDDNFWQVVT